MRLLLKLEKNNWAHTVSTETFTYQYLSNKGSCEAHKQPEGYVVPPEQIMTQDSYGSYTSSYPNTPHAFCNAHIVRELQGLLENDKRQWAQKMKALLIELNHKVKTSGIIILEKKEYLKRYHDICNIAQNEEPLYKLTAKGVKPNKPQDAIY